jgi:BASS family bile acid:Na+ symporter
MIEQNLVVVHDQTRIFAGYQSHVQNICCARRDETEHEREQECAENKRGACEISSIQEMLLSTMAVRIIIPYSRIHTLIQVNPDLSGLAKIVRKSVGIVGKRSVDFIANVGIPLLVAVAMTAVGLELTLADFRRVLRFPRAVMATIACQLVVLPAVAWLTAELLQADSRLAASLMLVAASPIATSANYYALLGRGDVALSVTLTAMSNLVALFATPLVVAAAFDWLLQDQANTSLPIAPAARQLLLVLVLPIAAGMLIRGIAPVWTQHYRKTAQGLSLVALALIIVAVLADQVSMLRSSLLPLALATLFFTAITLAIGYVLAAALWREPGERTSVAIGFCDRNLSVAMMLAATMLGRIDFVSLSAAFFVMQAMLLLPVVLWLRRQRAGAALTT